MLSPAAVTEASATAGTRPSDSDTPTRQVGPAALTPNSATAKALFSVWSGQRVTVVDSPPGAGKTAAVVTITAHLHARSNLSVVIATSTRQQAFDLAERLTEQVPAESIYLGLSSVDKTMVPEGVETGSPMSGVAERGPKVVIRTVASCRLRPPECSVLVIDEAYQSHFAAVSAAADRADQVLLVGDPGQIGPVITCDTSLWDRRKKAPHFHAPVVFAQRSDAVVHNFDATWRLGPATVAAIAPLYRFPFTSCRPDRHLEAGGEQIAEIESVQVPSSDGNPYHLPTMAAVADRAANLVGTLLVEALPDGSVDRRPLDAEDVAVVVSHNGQATAIEAMLADEGIVGVTVGTADRLQGGQWHAVVALDPMCGVEGLSPHALALGRLCVMASRHMTHLTWVHDGTWRESLVGSDAAKSKTNRVAARVRTLLVGGAR